MTRLIMRKDREWPHKFCIDSVCSQLMKHLVSLWKTVELKDSVVKHACVQVSQTLRCESGGIQGSGRKRKNVVTS